jgi:hypothetical protein
MNIDDIKDKLIEMGFDYIVFLANEDSDPLIEEDTIELVDFPVIVQIMPDGDNSYGVIATIDDFGYRYKEYTNNIDQLIKDLQKAIS